MGNLSNLRTADSDTLPRVVAALPEADEDSRKVALAALAAYGRHASQYADDVVKPVEGWDEESTDAFAWMMAAMGVDRCLPLFRGRVLAGHFTYRTTKVLYPQEFEGYEPPVLGEVLAPLAAYSDQLLGPLLRLAMAPTTSDRVKEQLFSALKEWGARTAPVALEVASALGSGDPGVDIAAAGALAAAGMRLPTAVVDLLDRYLAAAAPAFLEVAYARWRITGELQPALGALGAAVEAGGAHYVRPLAHMGSPAHRYVPAVRGLLSQRRLTARVEAAHALWMMGDSVPAAPFIMAEAVRPLGRGLWRPPVTPALRYLSEMRVLPGEAADVLATAVSLPRRLDGLHGGWRRISEDREVESLARSVLALVQDR